jgi:hypothetical protein
MTIFEEFITIEMLQSFPGMVIMVAILTQFSKSIIDTFFKTRTKFIVYLYALALNFFISYIRGFEGDIVAIIVMNILNSVIVALAAMKAFETISGN